MKKNSPIAKAKYVVETHCGNGNVFLHGPFGSKTKAEEYVETCEEDRRDRLSTHKVRMVMHPNKWTKGSS